MIVLLLVRHAAYDGLGGFLAGRASGISLDARGREQADHLARRLEAAPVTAIQASPLERAQATAAPIARRKGLDVETVAELNEVEFGAWTGRGFAELDEDPRWRRWNAVRSGARAPGGETILEVQARMLGHVERLRRERPGETVVLVSHGDVIRAALAYWLAVPLDLFRRIEVSPASVSTVQLSDDGEPSILGLNG